ncbi:MAG: tetratricopeptide repeat protein [Methanomicrobiales archaeon]|nr:tetratricopeptide repeat protein [Methanomicrobiales archaeon]
MKQIYLMCILFLLTCIPASASYDYTALSLTGLQISDSTQIDALLDELQIDPDQAEIWSKLAGVYLITGQYDKAITAYNYALTLNPDQLPSWKGLGYAHLQEDDFENGILAHEEALRLDPTNRELQQYIAMLYNDIGQHARAMELYQATGTPTFTVVRYQTGPCSWQGETSGSFVIKEYI